MAAGVHTRVLLVSGSTRHESTNTAALVTMAALAPDDVTAVRYGGLSSLPAFNPDDEGDRLPSVAADLLNQLAAADAVLFCTPEYAGNLPGSFKNLLDWTVGGGQLYGKPVAWINVAAAGRGTGATAALASVLGYVGAVVVEAACRHIPVDRKTIGSAGTVEDPQFVAEIAQVWSAVLGYLLRLRDGPQPGEPGEPGSPASPASPAPCRGGT